MSQSLVQIYIHWVFSTKDRQPFLRDRDIRAELHKPLGGIAKNLGCNPLRIGGVEDHVHMLTTFGRQIEVSAALKEFKRASNNWIAANRPIEGFKWQGGYGAFSVSHSQVPKVIAYIENQEEHHRRISFKDEMRELFRRHGVEFDERYVRD